MSAEIVKIVFRQQEYFSPCFKLFIENLLFEEGGK